MRFLLLLKFDMFIYLYSVTREIDQLSTYSFKYIACCAEVFTFCKGSQRPSGPFTCSEHSKRLVKLAYIYLHTSNLLCILTMCFPYISICKGEIERALY